MDSRITLWKLLVLAGGLVSFSHVSQAIDPRGVQIVEKWSVVGVIADGDTKGIAVIKDQEKTYTVKIGDLLPNNPDYRVKSVRRKQVILTDGSDEITIQYQAPSRDAWEDEEPVSRFAESYFTGFSTVPLDYYQKRKDAGVSDEDGLENMPFMMKKIADPAGGDYELFRREKPYDKTYRSRDGVEEDVNDSDVYVHYDNFTEDESFSDEEKPTQKPQQKPPGWETIPRRALEDSYSDNEENRVDEPADRTGWEDENVEEVGEEWEEPSDW